MFGLVSLVLAAPILRVSAAASLRESFDSISREFEAAHPGIHVELNFAGSQELAAQIEQGAPCDVFASADTRNIEKVHLQGSYRVFARNRLVIVGPNPGRRLDLQGLAKVHHLVLAAPQVPAGGYAAQAIKTASKDYGAAWGDQVKAATVSLEPDVRAVLAKVELKEAEAGIVYATDAISAKGKVKAYPIEKKYQPVIAYPIGIPSSVADEKLAQEFVRLVVSHRGATILRSEGFETP